MSYLHDAQRLLLQQTDTAGEYTAAGVAHKYLPVTVTRSRMTDVSPPPRITRSEEICRPL